MVIELRPEEFEAAKNLFDANMFQIPALAVLGRKFPGKVFADKRDEPGIAIVWALSRWSYISCGRKLREHKRFIAEAFDSFIIPLLKEVGEDYFEIYADNTGWDNALGEALGAYKLYKHYENTFTLNAEKFDKLDLHIEYPQDIEIAESMFPVMPEEYYKYLSYDIPTKNVYRVSLIKNGKTISRCVCNGFTHGSRYFIDLDTFSGEERNKGYGTYIAYKLISNMLKQGFVPLWETTVDNIPSQRIAGKLGFEKAEEYPVYALSDF